jgi:hypothetical protein
MLKKLEIFMRYKKNSVVVYLFLLLMLTVMISVNRGHSTTDQINGKKVSFPVNQETANAQLFKNC